MPGLQRSFRIPRFREGSWEAAWAALAAVATASLARLLLEPFGTMPPYPTFLVGIAFAGYSGGRLGAAVALGGSMVTCAFLFVPLQFAFAVQGLDNWLGLAVFAACGAVIGELAAAFRRQTDEASALADSNALLERRYRTVLESSVSVIWFTNADGEVEAASDRWENLSGQQAADYRGLGGLSAVHPEDRDMVHDRWMRAVRSGAPYEAKFRLHHADTGRSRWVVSRAVPVRDDAGRIVEWAGSVTDVDALERANQDKDTLILELQHRASDILSTCLALLNQTARRATGADDLETRLRGRIEALAAAHVLLFETEWRPADAAVLADRIVSPLLPEGGSLTLPAPGVLSIAPDHAIVLAQVLHELAANARRHGAWRMPGGAVTLEVRRTAGGDIALSWTEQCAEGAPPSLGTEGGLRLVARALQARLGGEARFARTPDGVSVDLRWREDGPLRAAG